jgi:hypothetical protein
MIAIFLFYSISAGPQAWLAFSKEFRHSTIIIYDGKHWINYEFDKTGFHTRVLNVTDSNRFISRLTLIKELSAIICVSLDTRTNFTWSPFLIRSCNEIDRYISSVEIGLTWNPKQLYFKLLKYDKIRNYEILYAWRRNHGVFRRGELESRRGSSK